MITYHCRNQSHKKALSKLNETNWKFKLYLGKIKENKANPTINGRKNKSMTTNLYKFSNILWKSVKEDLTLCTKGK